MDVHTFAKTVNALKISPYELLLELEEPVQLEQGFIFLQVPVYHSRSASECSVPEVLD